MVEIVAKGQTTPQRITRWRPNCRKLMMSKNIKKVTGINHILQRISYSRSNYQNNNIFKYSKTHESKLIKLLLLWFMIEHKYVMHFITSTTHIPLWNNNFIFKFNSHSFSGWFMMEIFFVFNSIKSYWVDVAICYFHSGTPPQKNMNEA